MPLGSSDIQSFRPQSDSILRPHGDGEKTGRYSITGNSDSQGVR